MKDNKPIFKMTDAELQAMLAQYEGELDEENESFIGYLPSEDKQKHLQRMTELCKRLTELCPDVTYVERTPDHRDRNVGVRLLFPSTFFTPDREALNSMMELLTLADHFVMSKSPNGVMVTLNIADLWETTGKIVK